MMTVREILRKSDRLLSPFLSASTSVCTRSLHASLSKQRASEKEKRDIDPDPDEPIQFSKTKAAEYDSLAEAKKLGRQNRPKYESEITTISFVIFMIYFCILREESDLDENLWVGKPEDGSLTDLERTLLRIKRERAKQGKEIFTEEDELKWKELNSTSNK